MRQYEAIEIITEYMNKLPEVEFIFLAGSLINNSEDECSDINYYCGVVRNSVDTFKMKLLNVLEKYHQVLYYQEIDSTHIKFIYDNAVILILNIVYTDEITVPEKYCSLYDAKGVLKDKYYINHKLLDCEIAQLINEFSVLLLEFKTAYIRKDVVYSLDLCVELSEKLGLFLRAIDNPNNQIMSMKKCFESLSKEHRLEYSKIIKEIKYNSLLNSVQLMVLMMNQEVQIISLEIGQYVNFDLYQLAKKELFSINK